MDTDNSIQNSLEKWFGFSEFRGEQEAIVSHVCGGGSAFVLIPTGVWKSICYQLPALVRGSIVFIVSPLVALMKDQVDELKRKGVSAENISSWQSLRKHREILGAAKQGRLKLPYVSPQRIGLPNYRSFLKHLNVSLFAIDEAQCISQWGHDFRDSYRALGGVLQEFPDVPKIALTATADPETQADIVRYLSLEDATTFVSSFARKNISISAKKVDGDAMQAVSDFVRGHDGHCGIICWSNRRAVDETVITLTKRGINAVGYHAGISAEDRVRCQERSSREADIVVVATIAFGIGIDRSDVRFVLHMEPPSTLEAYYQ